jgi:hypothetical protein
VPPFEVGLVNLRAGDKDTGLPYQLIVGPKGPKSGEVEVKDRKTGAREAWAPLTFKDEADAGPARLADPVAPARRSQAALDKVHTRTLADGTPAMSFTRLLAHLATIVRNTMRPRTARPGEATFTLTTRSDAKQQQALDLIAAVTL